MSFRTGRSYTFRPNEFSTFSSKWNAFLGLVLVSVVAAGCIYFEIQRYEQVLAFHDVSNNITCLGNLSHVTKNDILSNVGKLVYFKVENVVSNQVLRDNDLNLSFPNTLKFKRNVEYCQWSESSTSEKDRETGDVTVRYYYVKSWSSYRIMSLFFDQPAAHHNPHYDPYPPIQNGISSLKVGPLILQHALVDKAHDFKNLEMWKKTDIEEFKSSLASVGSGLQYIGKGYFYYSHITSTTENLFRLAGQALEGSIFDYQLGDLFSACNAGDIRLSYQIIPLSQGISVVGEIKDASGSVDVYRTKRGYPVGFVSLGDVPPKTILENELGRASWSLYFSRFIILFGIGYVISDVSHLSEHYGLWYLATFSAFTGIISFVWVVLYGMRMNALYLILSFGVHWSAWKLNAMRKKTKSSKPAGKEKFKSSD